MSFTERAGLFPVLLLTGCASPVVVTGPPSGSVVDGYLTRSAADISAMQYRLHQSGPTAQRPVSPSALRPVSSPKLGTSSPMLSRPASSMVTARGKPLAGGASKAVDFISDGGVAPTLRAAIRKIVPKDRTLVFDNAMKPDAPEFYTWKGNDRWPYVLNQLLSSHGLKATINETSHTVTVEPIQTAQATKIIPKTVGVPMLVGPVRPADLPPSNRNPFRGASASQLKGGSINTGAIVPVRPSATVMKVWKIEKGSTLRQGFMLWASQERCSSEQGKWTVRWDTGTDYPVDFPLTFTASSFEDATAQLFTLWRSAQVPLFVKGYRQQCLIVISDGR